MARRDMRARSGGEGADPGGDTRTTGARGGDREPEAERDRERWAARGRALAAAQQGDGAAYQRLLEELLPVVRAWVRARLFDPDAAEDVVQNALLNIHRARHTYRAERPLAPWLHTVVRNAVIDSLRERGRLRAREVPVEGFDALPGAAVDPVPPSEPLSPDLLRALESLPGKQRQAVELIQLEGLSVAEAALRAGVAPGTLKVRAHRGYRALRDRLGGVTPSDGPRGGGGGAR